MIGFCNRDSEILLWKNTVFFTHTIPNTAWPILYTPASMQLLMTLWLNDDEDRPDLTKMLITVIPQMAMVRLMTMYTVIAQEHMEQPWALYDTQPEILRYVTGTQLCPTP